MFEVYFLIFFKGHLGKEDSAFQKSFFFEIDICFVDKDYFNLILINKIKN